MPEDRRVNVYEECEVKGAILLIIRLQRFFGLAPVHIRKCGSKYFIRPCRLYLYLGYLFAITHCVLLLSAMIWDICIKDTHRTIHFGSPYTAAIWVTNILHCLILFLFGCFGAEKRMKHFMYYLKETNQINLLVNNQRVQSKEIYNVALIIFSTLWLIMCLAFQYFIAYENCREKKLEMIIFYLNTAKKTRSMHVFLLGILYTFTVQLFNASFRFINCQLENVIMDVNKNVIENNGETNTVEDPLLKFSSKTINRAIDQLGVMEFKRPASTLSEDNEKKLHQLLRQYDRVCALIGGFNKRDGLLFLFVIMTYVLYIVMISFNAISTITSAETTTFWIYLYISQVIWIVFVAGNVMTMVNACRRTSSEMTETKRLVSCLMSHISGGDDPLYKVLDTYYYRLRLYNVQYSPLGLVTLNDNFLFTIMGGVITYLIIFVDFNFESVFI